MARAKDSSDKELYADNKLYSRLFPGSDCSQVREINLANFFKSHQLDEKWDMTSAASQSKLLELAQSKNNACTYGGFLEDRTQLWKGVYPSDAKTKVVHLGVDINNVLVNQPVASLTNGLVVHVIKDHSAQRGWGGAVVCLTDMKKGKNAIYILYAHLSDALPTVGTKVKPGTIIGFIGAPALNGGWFPHLHLQIMTAKFLKPYDDLSKIDGYQVWPVKDSHTTMKQLLKSDGLIDPLEFVKTLP